jgi:Na+-transporting NADH:ubiquinone oxidoreductase subunit NqrB
VILSAIATCLLVQSFASLLQSQPETRFAWIGSLRSALITGLRLLLRTDHWYTMAFASAVAILNKFLIRVNHTHLFNLANAGIIASLVLTHDAWVFSGQYPLWMHSQ